MAAACSSRHSLGREEEEKGGSPDRINDKLGLHVGFYTKTVARVHTS